MITFGVAPSLSFWPYDPSLAPKGCPSGLVGNLVISSPLQACVIEHGHQNLCTQPPPSHNPTLETNTHSPWVAAFLSFWPF